MVLSDSASPNVHHGELAKSQSLVLYPQNSELDMAGSRARGPRHSHLPTPSISPTVGECDISSAASTISTPTTYGAYGAGYDNPPQTLVQWTEPGHGVNLHLAITGTGPEPSFLSAVAPVSPTPTPTQQTFDHSHRKCGPEFAPWQDTQTLPSWPHDVPGYLPGYPPRPEDSTALFRYHSNQLIGSCFDPITGSNYDLGGSGDQLAGRARPAKMETLRKRRNNAPSESSAEERQTKARMTRRKATGKLKINTQSTTSATSETKGRTDSTVTFGSGGMLSPTSPFVSSDAHDDTEENAEDEMTYSEEENNFDTEQGAGRDTARLKHNKVERKYRNRLNSHFEQLLGVLPPAGGSQTNSHQPMAAPTLSSNTTTRRAQGQKAASSRKDRERKVSKSEVLDRARVYIQSLESQHQRLIAERKELLQMWEEYGKSVQVGPPRR